jgi:hypothetical protein
MESVQLMSTGTVSDMSTKDFVMVEDAKYVEEKEDDDTEAEPAEAVYQSCLDGEAVVSEAQSNPVEELPAQNVSTLSAVSQPCQEGGAGVSGAQSHPVEELPAQNVSTLSAVSQS